MYALYNYFKPDLGQRFYIPLIKILRYRFEKEKTTLIIQFLNYENNEDHIALEKIEPDETQNQKTFTSTF